MRRRLLSLLTLLLLALCLASVALWVRSYWVADAWGWSSGKRAAQCGLASGRLRLDTTRLLEGGGTWGGPSVEHVRYAAADDPPTHRLPARLRNLGFAVERRREGNNYDSRLVLVPLWLPLLLLAATTLWLARLTARARREERSKAGLCPACGYDLRATPGRCPECGTEIRARDR
jgi:hypothetical protein